MMIKRCHKLWLMVITVLICLSLSMDAGAQEITEDEGTDQAAADILTEKLDLTGMQELVDELLGEKSVSLGELFGKLMSGEEILSKKTVQEFLRGLLFSRIRNERAMFMKVLILVLFAAVFSGFSGIFEQRQIGETGFYIVYLLIFTLLMNEFYGLGTSLMNMLKWLTEFMRELSPVYFMTVAAASGAASATVFYEGVILLVWLLQWVLESMILPGANLYILLRFVNHLSREEMLGKMAELIRTLISWGLRSLLGLVAGLQIVRNLVAPVMDSLKRSAVGRTAGALPGVGNAVNSVTELVLTTAVLVRNSLGVMAVVLLFLAGSAPVIHYGLLSLSYRFLAAAAQPVSDKRLVECLATMGEGCAILLRIFLTAEVLCVLTLLILMAGGLQAV